MNEDYVPTYEGWRRAVLRSVEEPRKLRGLVRLANNARLAGGWAKQPLPLFPTPHDDVDPRMLTGPLPLWDPPDPPDHPNFPCVIYEEARP